MSAEHQIRAFIDRVLRLKEEQDALAVDIREVYAEAKSMGFDKTAMGGVVAHLRRIEKKGATEVQEAETIFDLYLSAYQRAAGTPLANAHTHEISNSSAATPIATDEQAGAGPSPRTAPADQSQAKASEDNGRITGGAGPVTGEASRLASGRTDADDGRHVEAAGGATSVVTNPLPQPSSSREADKAGDAPPPASSAVPDFVPAFLVPADDRPKAKLRPNRPNCLRPETCAGQGVKHCYSCEKAAAAASEAA